MGTDAIVFGMAGAIALLLVLTGYAFGLKSRTTTRGCLAASVLPLLIAIVGIAGAVDNPDDDPWLALFAALLLLASAIALLFSAIGWGVGRRVRRMRQRDAQKRAPITTLPLFDNPGDDTSDRLPS